MSCTSAKFPRGHIYITWLITDSHVCCETDQMNDLVLSEYSTVGSHDVSCVGKVVQGATEIYIYGSGSFIVPGLESGFEGRMHKVSGSLSSFTGNLFAVNALTKFNLRKSSGHHIPMIFQRMSAEGTSVEPPHFPVSSIVRPSYHSSDEDVGRKDKTSTIELYFYDGISWQLTVQNSKFLTKLNASTYAREPNSY
ncbi:unnamed protein product [Trichobilharzia regenti]|nr:unnamed protein product [Trichobilharzia regenti]